MKVVNHSQVRHEKKKQYLKLEMESNFYSYYKNIYNTRLKFLNDQMNCIRYDCIKIVLL